MLAAVILAGGESRRMGSPKALLPYQSRTFLEHLLDVARHPKIGLVRIVLGAHAEEIRGRLSLDPATVVVNAAWEQGQLTSIQAALRGLPPGATDGIVLFLVDHPLISAATLSTLVERFYASDKPIVLPAYKSKRGHPVIFASSLYPELLAAPLDKGARAVVWAHAADVLEVPTADEGVILNLNDAETLRRALARG
jgi:molybdenum cofactor cytidylyltransferase